MKNSINSFNDLVNTIQETHLALQTQSVKVVNVFLTARNWLIGFYIIEFEQNGEDRAKYGDNLLQNLSESIAIPGLSITNLKYCRLFYQVYPEIGQLMTDFSLVDNSIFKISQLLTDESAFTENGINYYKSLMINISFTHFVELIKIENPVKRKFYELFILKSQPSVKDLKREISTLSFERLGLSSNKTVALTQIMKKITPTRPNDIIKSHYIFEFLNIQSPELVEETKLENALINNLQKFIIELGIGFCFEARQKRILVGDEYLFIDLVFYHRILKCHVLIELKVDSFDHYHAAQLITYLNYYKKNYMEVNDNPPIGILLVTDKNNALVEYATANEKDRLFVSKYKLKLPTENELKNFIESELKNVY